MFGLVWGFAWDFVGFCFLRFPCGFPCVTTLLVGPWMLDPSVCCGKIRCKRSVAYAELVPTRWAIDRFPDCDLWCGAHSVPHPNEVGDIGIGFVHLRFFGLRVLALHFRWRKFFAFFRLRVLKFDRRANRPALAFSVSSRDGCGVTKPRSSTACLHLMFRNPCLIGTLYRSPFVLRCQQSHAR